MMAIDDDTFFAWLDGELESEQADRVAAEVANDPRLAQRAEKHRAFETRLRGAFDSIPGAPVPERLADAVKPSTAQVVPFAIPRRANNDDGRWAWPQWAAIAATLVLGIGLGTTLNSERGTSAVEVRSGKMFAAGQLDETLDRQLASAAAGDVRVALTFRDQSGTICRTFTEQKSSGLACRQGADWQVRGLFAAPEGQRSEYRMATGIEAQLAALIDSTIKGEPLDADEEEHARRNNWR